MLYVIATPIGNLSDLSARAIQVLKECNSILAEDTRRTKILLNHFEIQSSVHSFPAFAEKKKLSDVLDQLEQGATIALVSDAGMPGICDPGTFLIQGCHERGIVVDVIPGPSAVTTVAALSGLCEEGFLFTGYFPEKQGQLDPFFKRVEASQTTLIFFEAPHRLQKTLQECKKRYPDATLFLARELTKKFQEYDLGLTHEIADRWEKKEPRGEFVLCLKLKHNPLFTLEVEEVLSDIALLKKEGCSLKTACKLLAKRSNFSHQDLYKLFLEHQQN